jgi:anti-anti-sigma factor
VFELVGRPMPGGVTWVWTRKDLDLATVEAGRRELATLLDPLRSPGNVLIYLGCDYFVDLRGLRLLAQTASRVRAQGGALAVVAPPPCLQRMVRLSHLDAELPLVTTARHAAWWARSTRSGTR